MDVPGESILHGAHVLVLVLTTRLEGSHKIHIEDVTHISCFPGMLDVGPGVHSSCFLGTNGTFSNQIGEVSVQVGE